MARLRVDMPSLMLGIYMAVLLAFLAMPAIIVICVSLNAGKNVQFPPAGISLRWFAYVLEYPTFVNAILNSLKLGVLATAVSILLGVPAALALGRYRFPLRDSIEAFLLSPLSLPMIVLGIALLIFFGQLGVGLPFWGLLAGHVVVTIPYIVRTVAGVYRGLDRALEESAMVLGAGPWQVFRYITLPLIRSGIVAGAIFSFLISFDNVPISVFLTKTDTMTLPVVILSYLLNNFDPSVAAISTLEIGFVVVVLLLLDRVYGLNRMTSFGGQ